VLHGVDLVLQKANARMPSSEGERTKEIAAMYVYRQNDNNSEIE